MTSAESTSRPIDQDGCAIILGDWFVDEHWVFGVHRSSSSSRTGDAHYRALHKTGNPEIRAFCGTGRSAYFLHHALARVDGPRFFPPVIGLGFWHHSDTESLTALFSRTEHAHSPYRLRDKETVTGQAELRPTLLNLHDSFLGHRHLADRDNIEFTNRIIRIYRQGTHGKIRYERFDWERPPLRQVIWTPKQLADLEDAIKRQLDGRPVSLVLVKDLLKGAVTPTLVHWLAEGLGRSSRWYVSSKKWEPDWRLFLKGVDLQLFLIPKVAATEALTGPDARISSWLARAEGPTREALTSLDTLYQEIGGPSTSIVLTPGRFTFLCRQPSIKGGECIVQSVQEPELEVPMGGASIFFPALCAGMEHSRRVGEPARMRQILRHALKCTHEWVLAEGQRVTHPETWNPDPFSWDPGPSLFKNVSSCAQPVGRFDETREHPWPKVHEWWKTALDPDQLGVVTTEVGRQLQLWRSMVEVDGYVCCETGKRHQLRRLVQGIQSISPRPKSHAACMLIAAPGTGKTFLVRQLAKIAELRFVPFNITQMSSRSDILDCFEEILTTQAEDPDRHLLVFIDEVNTDLGGSSVYGSFLAPLEEGVYVRNGQTFHLRPCVWVFAGTDSPESESEDDRSQKGSDFVSRLTLGMPNISGDYGGNDDNDIRRERQLERIYLGAALLRQEFPDVRRVSGAVLSAFRALPVDARVRDIKHFVREFKNIQYGCVKSHNVPIVWPKDRGKACFEEWQRSVSAQAQSAKAGTGEKADIEIV